MPSIVLVGNPAKRRKARKSKGRSAAQKAATRRMLAANRSRRGGSRSAVKVVHVSAPAKRRSSRRRSAVKSFTGRVKRSFRRNPIGMPTSLKGALKGAFEMLKNGAVGGAGAVGVDIEMGFAVKAMPATMVPKWGVKFNPESGELNWGYYAIKTALAVGTGMLGMKVLPAGWRVYAARAAEGSLANMTADLIRLKMPPNLVTLGYASPSQILPGNQPVPGNVQRMPARRLAGVGGGGMGRGAGMGSTNVSPARVLRA